MPEVPQEFLRRCNGMITALRTERLSWWNLWRELADFYLPRRYVWLQSKTERAQRHAKNPNILDSTGTTAARVLASGMMNGITSPSRPWFKLRIASQAEESHASRVWLDEVERRMMTIMAESNFYNSMAVLYLDLTIFGSAASLIYESTESVIHCYNPPLGEYYFSTDHNGRINRVGREFHMQLGQMVTQFGKENLSQTLQDQLKRADANLFMEVPVCCLIEPNTDREVRLSKSFGYREIYWEKGQADATRVLSLKGFSELPGMFPRWDVSGNAAYGGCPALDALGDVIQLQHETKRKAQAIDKLVSPPILADMQLKNSPMSLLPNGVTYVARVGSTEGARPIYTVQPPLNEMTMDMQMIQARIRETFHNPLFNMISQLDTVRSATEIDARREEKLVLLGPVLERFENEALDPGINRIFGIMSRQGLLPEAPPEIADAEIDIQYISILSVAQRAIATAPTERWLAVLGNAAALYPGAVDLPNFDELLLRYGRDIGVHAAGMNDPDQVAARRQQREAPQQAAGAVEMAGGMAQAGKLASETTLGGGRNVLAELLG